MAYRISPLPMSKTLHLLACLPLAVCPALTLNANAQVDPKIHEQCLRASDYKGCAEALSGNAAGDPRPNELEQLRKALRLLPSRLENTSLRDFTSNTQIFYDALSGITQESLKSDYEKEFYREAVAIRGMTDALQSAWSERIREGTSYSRYGSKSYRCSVLKSGVDSFNAVAGPTYSVPYNGTMRSVLFMPTEECSPQEIDMVTAISRRVSDALVDPRVREAELAKQRREDELSRLAPWQRHLEENPQLKRWAEANPKQAEKAREKFLSDLKRQK